ncbi:Acylamino-acid-releasing enzyme [Halotydeus destructor]|nr:Acylamino-acid-releasing enzyme [Halotydeus destructor]
MIKWRENSPTPEQTTLWAYNDREKSTNRPDKNPGPQGFAHFSNSAAPSCGSTTCPKMAEFSVDPSKLYTCPNGQQVTIRDLVSVYRDLVKVPIPTAGVLSSVEGSDKLNLRVSYSSRDVDVLEQNSFAKFYSVSTANDSTVTIEPSTPPMDISNEEAYAVSASGKLRATLRAKKVNDKEKKFLDIWDSKSKVQTVDIEALDAHGDIRTSFGRISFSPDNSKVLYVAEKKKPKASSFYQRNLEKQYGDDKSGKVFGTEFIHEQDWGEACHGIVHTVICVLTLKDLKVSVTDVPNYSASDAFWISATSVGFIGWNEQPRKLGLIRTNRPSKLFVTNAEYNAAAVDSACAISQLTGDNLCVRCPRMSPSGRHLVWLENSASGPYHRASMLVMYTFESKKRQVLVDVNVKQDNLETIDVSLKALYIHSIPDSCWSLDETFLLFHADTCNRKVLWSLEVISGKLRQLPFPLKHAELLGVKDDILVAIGQSADVKPSVHLAKFGSSLTWCNVEDVSKDVLPDIAWRRDVIASEVDQNPVFGILVSPKSVQHSAAPVVVIPHGGPHETFLVSFMRHSVLFAKLGFKTLFVDYRGSIGVDDEYIHALLGKVGDHDVQDVVSAINHYAHHQLIDKSRIVLWGGSHGGFLAAHLTGQFAHLNFVACIARNPVTDIASMTEVSDIPDWCWTEAVGQTRSDSKLNPDMKVLQEMYTKSPMFHVDKVRTPTLVILGKTDKRVPMSQGLKWYNTLRENGVETRCLVYDDKHELQKVEVDSDAFIQTMLWIFDHMPSSNQHLVQRFHA